MNTLNLEIILKQYLIHKTDNDAKYVNGNSQPSQSFSGRFSGHGKASFFKVFFETKDRTFDAFKQLSSTNDLEDEVFEELSKFVCNLYAPKDVAIENIGELRWYMFCKKNGREQFIATNFCCFKAAHITFSPTGIDLGTGFNPHTSST